MIYTAITIGPISDTMDLTASPAGLWGASYIFSDICRALCEELIRGGVPQENIFSPYFDVSGDETKPETLRVTLADAQCKALRQRGVGMFFDRVEMTGDHLDAARKAIRSVTDALAGLLADVLGPDYQYQSVRFWLGRYLRLYACRMEIEAKKPPVELLGDTLAAMELEPCYVPREVRNPLLQLLEAAGSYNYKNYYLKKYAGKLEEAGILSPGRWMLLKGDKIRDLTAIARPTGRKFWKTDSYYAVLSSDGDNMGKLYKQIVQTGDIKAMSKKTLGFCAKAAKLILDYGGLPIYAGGDDLLALLPLRGQRPGKKDIDVMTLPELLKALNELFDTHFDKEKKEYNGAPSLSIGVAVQFVKSPLYEALHRAEDMLYEAKHSTDAKNALRVHVMKHSGQSMELAVDCMSGSDLPDILNELIAAAANRAVSAKSTAVFLQSAEHSLESMKALFVQAVRLYMNGEKETLKNFFENRFDSIGQKPFAEILEKFRRYCETTADEMNKYVPKELSKKAKPAQDDGDNHRKTTEELAAERCLYAFRTVKFMAEKGTEKE